MLEYGGKFYVVGSGRQALQKNKTQTEDYYLLTLAAIAKEISFRHAEPAAEIHLSAGLPLTSFGREKNAFRDYLLRDGKTVSFRYEGQDYSITMNYNYLTLNHITAYEEFLCREERSAATKEKYLRSVRTFHSWAHGQAITKETVTAWKNCLIEQKYAPSTINTMLAALNRLFAFMGWTDCCAKYLKVQRRMFRESSRELTKEEYCDELGKCLLAFKDGANSKIPKQFKTRVFSAPFFNG